MTRWPDWTRRDVRAALDIENQGQYLQVAFPMRELQSGIQDNDVNKVANSIRKMMERPKPKEYRPLVGEGVIAFAKMGNKDALKMLLHFSAGYSFQFECVTQIGDDGYTALHKAILNCNPENDPHKDDPKQNPENAHFECVKLLLDYDADPFQVTKNNETIFDILKSTLERINDPSPRTKKIFDDLFIILCEKVYERVEEERTPPDKNLIFKIFQDIVEHPKTPLHFKRYFMGGLLAFELNQLTGIIIPEIPLVNSNYETANKLFRYLKAKREKKPDEQLAGQKGLDLIKDLEPLAEKDPLYCLVIGNILIDEKGVDEQSKLKALEYYKKALKLTDGADNPFLKEVNKEAYYKIEELSKFRNSKETGMQEVGKQAREFYITYWIECCNKFPSISNLIVIGRLAIYESESRALKYLEELATQENDTGYLALLVLVDTNRKVIEAAKKQQSGEQKDSQMSDELQKLEEQTIKFVKQLFQFPVGKLEWESREDLLNKANLVLTALVQQRNQPGFKMVLSSLEELASTQQNETGFLALLVLVDSYRKAIESVKKQQSGEQKDSQKSDELQKLEEQAIKFGKQLLQFPLDKLDGESREFFLKKVDQIFPPFVQQLKQKDFEIAWVSYQAKNRDIYPNEINREPFLKDVDSIVSKLTIYNQETQHLFIKKLIEHLDISDRSDYRAKVFQLRKRLFDEKNPEAEFGLMKHYNRSSDLHTRRALAYAYLVIQRERKGGEEALAFISGVAGKSGKYSVIAEKMLKLLEPKVKKHDPKVKDEKGMPNPETPQGPLPFNSLITELKDQPKVLKSFFEVLKDEELLIDKKLIQNVDWLKENPGICRQIALQYRTLGNEKDYPLIMFLEACASIAARSVDSKETSLGASASIPVTVDSKGVSAAQNTSEYLRKEATRPPSIFSSASDTVKQVIANVFLKISQEGTIEQAIALINFINTPGANLSCTAQTYLEKCGFAKPASETVRSDARTTESGAAKLSATFCSLFGSKGFSKVSTKESSLGLSPASPR